MGLMRTDVDGPLILSFVGICVVEFVELHQIQLLPVVPWLIESKHIYVDLIDKKSKEKSKSKCIGQ